MREQLIVWRDDFENIELPYTSKRSFSSNKALVKLPINAFAVGYFVRLIGTDRIDFHAEGIAFYSTEVIKEFAFLE